MVYQTSLQTLQIASRRSALIGIGMSAVRKSDEERVILALHEIWDFSQHTRQGSLLHIVIEYQRLGWVAPEMV